MRLVLPSISTLTGTFYALVLLFPHGANALWPQPRSLQTGSTALRLRPSSFTINPAEIPDAPSDLLEAVHRTHAHLASDKLARLDVSRGAADVPVVSRADATLPGLRLRLLRLDGDDGPPGAASVRTSSIAEEARAPLGLRDEGYNLSVPVDGSEAVLSAASALGLFRGLNAFAQLWYYYDHDRGGAAGRGSGDGGDYDGGGPMVYMLAAPVMIEDWPAYVRRRGIWNTEMAADF
jgi:hexosaminidase